MTAWPQLYAQAWWKKARRAFLDEHPLCSYCLELDPPRYTAGTVVSHDPPHRGDPEKFADVSTWRASCKACHDRHGQRADHRGIVAGCDRHGIPLDDRHPWRK